MVKIEIKRDKLIKFLIKEIPGLIPYIGNIWKDMVDEFTESDFDKTLEQIEDFQKKDLKMQQKILSEILSLRSGISKSNEVILRMEQRERNVHIVGQLVRANIGNSRFLLALQKSDESFQLGYNVTREFREQYLDMLENVVMTGEMDLPTFAFEMLDALVAFPDGYEEYAIKFRNPGLHRPSTPVLIENVRLTKEDNVYYIEGGNRVAIPWLPTQSGFIQEVHEELKLPKKVGHNPSDQYCGAHYWVRPYGLRIVAMGIGVLDPLECQFGTAIWWRSDEASPFLGVRSAIIATKDYKRQMHKATVRTYVNVMKKHVENQKS